MKGRTGNLHASKSRSIKRPVTPATICFLYLKKKKTFSEKLRKVKGSLLSCISMRCALLFLLKTISKTSHCHSFLYFLELTQLSAS